MSDIEKIEKLRKSIDVLDKKIVNLLAKRFNKTEKIQVIKRKSQLPIHQPEREKSLLEKHRKQAHKLGVSPEHIQKIFKAIFSEAKKYGNIERWKKQKKPDLLKKQIKRKNR